jgi:hypothetical protein
MLVTEQTILKSTRQNGHTWFKCRRYGTYGILCEGRTVAELLFVKRCKLTHSQIVGINHFNTGVNVFGRELPLLDARPTDGNLSN